MQQDVLGLDVAVNDAVPVRVVECVGHFPSDPHRFVHAELRLAGQLLPDRLPLYVRHHIEEEPIRGAAIKQRQNVRMAHRRRGLDLHHESLGAEHRCEFGLQHLDRDLAVMLQVLGEIDRRHAPSPELALDAVAARQSGGESVWSAAHFLAPCAMRSRSVYFQSWTIMVCELMDVGLTSTKCWPSGATSYEACTVAFSR